ncbi:MAG: hypothetical protein WD969_06350 [Paracoccaceae bacterium]
MSRPGWISGRFFTAHVGAMGDASLLARAIPAAGAGIHAVLAGRRAAFAR